MLLFISIILLSCSEELKPETGYADTPRLLSFVLHSGQNLEILQDDVEGEIIGDSIVECWIPYLVPDKHLAVDIQSSGGGIFVGGSIFNEKSRYDFSRPVTVMISDGNIQKDYKVYIHSFTGLPVLWVETEQRLPITSVDDYIAAHFILQEDVVTRGAGERLEIDGKIRGRGNSTWVQVKKPYRIKFDKKESVFGEAADKNWVLLANYFDKSMLRNALAFYLGSLSNLQYTPKFHFMELMLNGRYTGTYQLTEALKVNKNRINIGEDGFLLEIDNHLRENEVSFTTPRLEFPIRIHEPELTVEDPDYIYIRDYMLKAEEALFSDDFLDEHKGYRQYFDIESFADWYVITELLENPEAGDGYMSKTRNGKLHMGPLWDFDLAIGNNAYATYGDDSVNPYFLFTRYQHYNPYWNRLFQDPQFVSLVKSRMNYFISKKDDIMRFINEYALYLKKSVAENDNRWGLLYQEPRTQPQTVLNVWGSYQNEVQYIKNFLNLRIDWLKKEFETY